MENTNCYRPNEDPYPLCKGASHPVEFAENDCIRCNLYENMDESIFDENFCLIEMHIGDSND